MSQSRSASIRGWFILWRSLASVRSFCAPSRDKPVKWPPRVGFWFSLGGRISPRTPLRTARYGRGARADALLALLGRRSRAPLTRLRGRWSGDSRGSGGIRQRNLSDGIRHRKIGFSVMESGTEVSAFSGTGFCFARGSGDGLGIVSGLYAPPLVRWASATQRQVCQPVGIWKSVLAGFCSAMLAPHQPPPFAPHIAFTHHV